MSLNMSFSSREISRYSGHPFALFRFGFGTRIIGYTSSEQPINFNGETYEPIPIERNAITQSGTLDKSNLAIRLPVSTEIVEIFRAYPPSDVVGVTIFQGHIGEDEILAIFVGRVLSAGRKGRIATLNCEPASTMMRRPGLRRHWQYMCPHVLYGTQCRASRPAHTYNGTVESVSTTTVKMVSGWHGPLQRRNFENGIFEWDGPNGIEMRNILRVTDDELLLDGRLRALPAGTPVRLSAGCAHNMADCQNVFNNILNFGGDPWIPVRNPVGFVNHFY